MEAAKAVRGIAGRTTAITADAGSVLAQACDDLIKLSFRKTSAITPGTVSFTATLLACYSRVRELPAIPDLRRELDRCIEWADTVELPLERTVFMIGTGLSYCLAIYGTAKIYEVIGSKSQYQATEQFGHMELFSLSPGDLALLVPPPGKDEKLSQLESLLVDDGWKVARINSNSNDEVIHSILTAMHLQVLAWRTALRLGLKEFSFKKKEKHLRISSAMIY